jgi:hypothetical protein
MKKAKKRQREIRFHSQKCDRIICVNSYAEQEYAKRLETDEQVEGFEENCELDKQKFQNMDPVGIRSAYFTQEWRSDFLIHRTDGTLAVRELVRPEELTKATTLEQLEFSRRYWEVSGVSDWKIIIMKEGTAFVS